ncbi:MAG TPA: 3-phosphoshikimate 1-carboxyvinyltransferase, partial [Dehalococcoidia bacterium]|nr:3-phosphoshikimate 1-carboxyvinyltransferase [Dehalococcoidia bacterium]
AAAIHPDAEVRLTGVGIDETRAGVIDVLRSMGADLSVEEERQVGGEPVGDIVVRSSRLSGTEIGGETVVSAMDEVPVLAIAAAFAEGRTEVRDAAELRVKESDRIAAVVSQLAALGVTAAERADGLTIEGGEVRGGSARTFGDHRLAMALAVAGLASRDGVTIDDADCVAVSYPAFWEHLEQLAR